MDNNEIVKIFKALCDTKRIEIIKQIVKILQLVYKNFE